MFAPLRPKISTVKSLSSTQTCFSPSRRLASSPQEGSTNRDHYRLLDLSRCLSTSPSTKKTLWRWGASTGGESPWKTLFRSSTGTIVTEKSHVPERVEGFDGVDLDGLSAGYDHAGFTVEGQLYTFGSNDYGQLGREMNDPIERSTPKPVELPCKGKVVSVACGLRHSACVTDEGILYTWGWGGSLMQGSGALGNGTTESYREPRPIRQFVENQEKILKVACGSQHTIVLTESGRLFSTGKGEMGRLGLGSNQDKLDFQEIDTFCTLPFDVQFSKVACGGSHCVALLRSGEVFVWGRNAEGELGLDDSMGDMFSHEGFPRQLQSSVLDSVTVKDIACGENATAILGSDGEVFFFGARLWLTPKRISIPSEVVEQLKGDSIIKVSLGGQHYSFAYAMTRSGRLLSWGRPKSQCLARPSTKQDSGQPHLLDSQLFDNQSVIDVACGRSRVLATTSS